MTTQNDFNVAGTSNFATATNWSLGHVPTSTEDAEIDTANGVAVSTANELVNSVGLDTGDELNISGGVFTASAGTGFEANDGNIVVIDALFEVANGTIDNVGTISLEGTNLSNTGRLIVTGPVTLTGGGDVTAPTGGGVGSNLIAGVTISLTPTIVNVNNTISGDLTIGGDLVFTNGADGLIQTNNSSGIGGMAILGSGAGGSFTNDGSMLVNNGGNLVFGDSSNTGTIDNESSIVLQAAAQTTLLYVTGNTTISASGFGGDIEMEGPTPSNNRIVTLGEATTLTLVNQTLDGAGTVGDANLTLNLTSGTIEADLMGQVIFLYTGSNTIANGGTLKAIQGAALEVESPVNNNGTIAVSGTGSNVDLFATVSGSGAIDIGTGGTLLAEALVSGNVTFTGTNATLILKPGDIGGSVKGAVATDAFDFLGVNPTGDQVVWQQNGGGGTLLIEKNGTTLATLSLQGEYTSADFTPTSDGIGGTLLEVTKARPVEYDLNGDGVTDMLWRQNTGTLADWTMAGSAIASSQSLTSQGTAITPDSSWSIAGIGDFNGDANADVLWRQNTGALADWSMNGAAIVSSQSLTSQGTAITPDSSWSVAGIGDFNGDGDADILWRQNTGALADWSMNGAAISASHSLTSQGMVISPDSSWSVAGIGDFNGDGNSDILWRQSSTGAVADWSMNGSTITSSQSLTSQGSAIAPDSSWSVVGVGDFNGDGNSDILWRQSTTGSLAEWLMNGSTISSSAAPAFQGTAVSPDSTWNIVEVGDFNGSTDAGIIWQQSTTGSLVEWQMSGSTILSSQAITSAGTPVAPSTSAWQTQEKPADVA